MPKRAIAVVEVQDMKTSTLATEEEMAKRKVLADHIRARMAKPATAFEQNSGRSSRRGSKRIAKTTC